MHELLHALFNKDRIAFVQTKNPELIQNFLSLVPPSMRMIPFSTTVVDPNRQPHYNFILTEKTSRSISEKKFRIIDPELITKNEPHTF